MSVEGMNYDNILVKMLSRMGDVMLLSVLFALFSLPVFTIGASITALYYAGMKGVTLDGGYTFRYFIKSFKENFKQSTVIWLIFLAVSFVFGVDIYFWFYQRKEVGSTISNIMLVISVMLMLVNIFIFIYVFPLQAKFANKTSVQIKNAFFFSIKYFPTTMLILIIMAVAVWGVYYQPPLVLSGLIFIGFGIMGYLFSYLMLRFFKPFLKKKEEKTASSEAVFVDESHDASDQIADVAEVEKADDEEEIPVQTKSIADKISAVSRINAAEENEESDSGDEE